jgi:predicted RNase H-like HicB family nuclease
MKILNFNVIIEQDEDGAFIAKVPAVPGCHSDGDTYEEALENIQEALELCLEEAEANPEYKKKIEYPKPGTHKLMTITEIPITISG